MILENFLNIFLFAFINAYPANGKESEAIFISPDDALFNSVIISEIMADPFPSVKLPEYEYLEIYNRGNSIIDLYNWTLKIGTYKVKLPDIVISPDEYIIICDSEISGNLSNYGKVAAINNFPPILNSGQVLTLLSSSDDIIYNVTFSDKWYNDRNKSEGGWSLEIIDPENPCGKEENWKASEDISGGTPGKQNSVKENNPDHTFPELFRATLPDDSSVILHFSEPLHYREALSKDNYSTDYYLLHPYCVSSVTSDFSKILLKYHSKFNSGITYTINVLDNLKDCAGNKISNNTLTKFALSNKVMPFDIVINEILFDSHEGEAEFIELYNRSEKVINLSDLVISLADISDNNIKKSISLKEYPYILFPNDYVVITRKLNLMLSYKNVIQRVILEHPSFFKLPDDKGLILISDSDLNIIDKYQYDENSFNDFLGIYEGTSIERVNPDLPSDDINNWRSASTLSGYSTPGQVNSQFNKSDNNLLVNLSSETFSPDNDGIDDQLILNLQLKSADWIGSICIFDIYGRNIKTLVKKQLFGTSENYIWNGTSDNGTTVDIGAYIIFCEIFNSGGESKSFKKVVSVIRK